MIRLGKPAGRPGIVPACERSEIYRGDVGEGGCGQKWTSIAREKGIPNPHFAPFCIMACTVTVLFPPGLCQDLGVFGTCRTRFKGRNKYGFLEIVSKWDASGKKRGVCPALAGFASPLTGRGELRHKMFEADGCVILQWKPTSWGPFRTAIGWASLTGLDHLAGSSGVSWQPSQILPCQLWGNGGLVG